MAIGGDSAAVAARCRNVYAIATGSCGGNRTATAQAAAEHKVVGINRHRVQSGKEGHDAFFLSGSHPRSYFCPAYR